YILRRLCGEPKANLQGTSSRFPGAVRRACPRYRTSFCERMMCAEQSAGDAWRCGRPPKPKHGLFKPCGTHKQPMSDGGDRYYRDILESNRRPNAIGRSAILANSNVKA